MRAYRVSFLTAKDQLRGGAIIEAQDDADAIQRARRYAQHFAVELSDGSRRVARLVQDKIIKFAKGAQPVSIN